MRGRLVRFAYLTRLRHPVEQAEIAKLPPKLWLYRLLDKTAAPLWFARVRRTLRHNYRDSIAVQMYLLAAPFYRVEVRGLENFQYQPSTIIACGHKRDMDIPIIIPRLYQLPPSWRHRQDLRLMYVATRDDIFERGFFTVYFGWLDMFRPIISRLRLGRLFRMLQACPVKLPDEQTVNQLLHETERLEGNLPLSEAFDPEWQARLLGATVFPAGLRLKDAIARAPLTVLSQYATPRIFREPLANRIRQRHSSTMHQQLRYITRILEKGGTLIVLPEGRITPDGRFCKMRAAVTRLITQARVETILQPVNLTYDFMDTRRPNVTMLVGPQESDLKNLSKLELAELIRQKVAGLACVSLSGVASRWLVAAAEQDRSEVSLPRLREELWLEIQRLRGAGLPLDRQVATRQEFEQRFERFLSYAHRQGGIFRPALQFAADSSPGAQLVGLDLEALRRLECYNYGDNPVRYCYNELTELLETWGALPEVEQPENVPLPFETVARRATAG